MVLFLQVGGDFVETCQASPRPGTFDQIADQLEAGHLGILHHQAGWMSQEIEHATGLNGPFHALANRREEPIELLVIRTKCRHVTDRAHRNLDKSRSISIGL